MWLKAKWNFKRKRMNESFTEENFLASQEWPHITIQLPIFNERNVVERLLRTCAQLGILPYQCCLSSKICCLFVCLFPSISSHPIGFHFRKLDKEIKLFSFLNLNLVDFADILRQSIPSTSCKFKFWMTRSTRYMF